MNWTYAGIVYLITVPTLLFLASKVHNQSIYKAMLGVVVLLSFIPIGVGINVMRITIENMDWSVWAYITGTAGIFCIIFGLLVLVPVYWLLKK